MSMSMSRFQRIIELRMKSFYPEFNNLQWVHFIFVLSVFNLVLRVFRLPTQRLQYFKEPDFNIFSITSTLRFCFTYRRVVIFVVISVKSLIATKIVLFLQIILAYCLSCQIIILLFDFSWVWLSSIIFICVLDTQVVIHNMNAFIGSIDVRKTVPLETQGLYMTWSPILNI